MWNMLVRIIPSVIGVLGTVFKEFEGGLEELEIIRIETIQITEMLSLARVLNKDLG